MEPLVDIRKKTDANLGDSHIFVSAFGPEETDAI